MRLNAPEEDSMKQEAAMYVCKPCFIVAWYKVLIKLSKEQHGSFTSNDQSRSDKRR